MWCVKIFIADPLSKGTCCIHIGALGMTVIMIYHVRSKYTAVGKWWDNQLIWNAGSLPLQCTGRKEILLFFYLYFIISLLAIFLDSGIIPTANVVYPVSCCMAHTVSAR